MVPRLLSEWCVATSFYHLPVNHVYFFLRNLLYLIDRQDEHLADDSEKFHKKMGFEMVGKHYQCGYKFGKWYSIIWMDKLIRKKVAAPAVFIPFTKIYKA